MYPDLRETIAALEDRQTIICCRALVILMDRHMARDTRSKRTPDLSVSDFHQWVGSGGRPVKALAETLRRANSTLTAAVGRRLMLTCLEWGCEDEVRSACCLIHASVDQLGALAPETIMAALAAVMLWHKARPTLKALLQPAATRRFPWLTPPDSTPRAQAPDKPPAERRHREQTAAALPMSE